jgi:hypothetical protein
VLLALFDHLAPRDLLPRNADEKKKRRRLLDMALWYMLTGPLSLPQGKRPTDEVGVDPEVPVDHLLHLLHAGFWDSARMARISPNFVRGPRQH